MSNFYLHLEAKPGSDIDNCASEAIDLANRLHVTVMFEFNGVKCMACRGDNPKSLASEAFRLINTTTGEYKLARGY